MNLESATFNHLLQSEQKLHTTSFCINPKTGNIIPASDIVIPELVRHKLTATQINQAQGFYHPRQMEPYGLHKKLGSQGSISSTTLPSISQKNVKLAGTRHPVTGIIFCERGFPIFDDIMKAEVRIPYEIASVKNRDLHMKAATYELKKVIEKNKMNFTEQQLKDIFLGKGKINEYTWHHHQDTGRMQLIPTNVHLETGHVGGMSTWFFNNKTGK